MSLSLRVSTYALLVEPVHEVVSDTVGVNEVPASSIQKLTKDVAEHLTTIYLKRCDRGKRCLYEGSTPPDGFPNSWNGASYCTSELAVLKNNEIHTWDRSYDEQGKQVWGVKNGPYEFKSAPGPPATATTSVDILSPLNFSPLSIGKRIEGSFVLQE